MITTGRKTVGIDIDGVLADYVAAIREVAARADLLLPEDLPTTYSMVEPGWFSDGGQWLRTHVAWAGGHVLTTPLLDGAAPGTLRAIREAGHRVVIVTARGTDNITGLGDDLVREDTRRWLDAHGLSHDGIHFVGDKSTVDWDLIIDDSPGQVTRLHDAGREVWVRDHRYNRSEVLSHLPRAAGLDEFAHRAGLVG